MASPITRKRARAAARVADMTPAELQRMIESSVERKLIEMFRDPDAGLELRPEIAEGLLRQEREFAAGKRGKPLALTSTPPPRARKSPRTCGAAPLRLEASPRAGRAP